MSKPLYRADEICQANMDGHLPDDIIFQEVGSSLHTEPIFNTRDKLYSLAIETWGVDAQILMAVEECAELQVELLHGTRKNKETDKYSLAGEIADVEIMLEQLKSAFSLNALVEDKKLWKLEKLNKYLKEAKSE